jgi:hypothetical protein
MALSIKWLCSRSSRTGTGFGLTQARYVPCNKVKQAYLRLWRNRSCTARSSFWKRCDEGTLKFGEVNPVRYLWADGLLAECSWVFGVSFVCGGQQCENVGNRGY